MKSIISVRDIGKKYRIFTAEKKRYSTLREDLAETTRQLFQGKLWQTKYQEFWALKDINFDVNPGEVVGIIGRNGAGKSTLLKILSRITQPTTGEAILRGRLASLLEVGTGFHPEMTGRENIFMSGTVLGMKRAEIKNKFDEIVAFAEVEKFLDTPVKRYSSGMYVRLAFAVAAHLEPDILLVDEVLAVGDFEFQRKCLAKMEDVSQHGRTVLFVSHNLGAVGRLCPKSILLSEGKIIALGETKDVLENYLSYTGEFKAEQSFPEDKSKPVQIRRLSLFNHHREMITEFEVREPFITQIEYEIRDINASFSLAWMLAKPDGTRVCESTDLDTRLGQYINYKPGRYIAKVEFPGGILNAGTYSFRVGITERGGAVLDYQDGLKINLVDHGSFASIIFNGRRLGLLLLNLPWQIINLDN